MFSLCCGVVILSNPKKPLVFIRRWNANYIRAQGLDVVESMARKTAVSCLSRWNLTCLEFRPNDEFIAWFRKNGKSLMDSKDYRIGYRGGGGWFLVNRYGYSLHDGVVSSFNVGHFERQFNRSDLFAITIDNQTRYTFKLFSSNGFAIESVAAHKSLIWRDGWGSGVIAQYAEGKFGLVEDVLKSGGSYGRLPPISGVVARESRDWVNQKITLTLIQSTANPSMG